MLDDYIQVIDGIGEEDEFEDEIFIMGKDFMRFRFKTDDKLVHIQKINVQVCVVSISSVIKKGDWHYPEVRLQECCYENDYLDENIEIL